MRIIAGTHRGRRLLGPAGRETTRPITDRVKTPLFDRLAATGRLDGAVVLDLFAGTGSMGLECLSRGAAHVTFVERDRSALQRLRRNLDAIRQTGDARVLSMDALGAHLAGAAADRRFTLIFVDPPYPLMRDPAGAARVHRQITRLAGGCAERATAILRTDRNESIGPIDGWAGPDSRFHGSMALHWFEKA